MSRIVYTDKDYIVIRESGTIADKQPILVIWRTTNAELPIEESHAAMWTELAKRMALHLSNAEEDAL